MKKIESLQNSTVKYLVRLRESSKQRKVHGKFSLEGARELSRALDGGYLCESLFYCRNILSQEARHLLDSKIFENVVEVNEAVFSKIAVREDSGGIFALMHSKQVTLADLPDHAKPLYLVLDQIEKPGNFGALARTSDGVGADALIILDPHADVYNPHAIRASVGSIFTRPIVACEHQDFLNFCVTKNIKILTASPSANRFYFQDDLNTPLAVVLGSEAHGLSHFWDDFRDFSVKIPMNGFADSLNVSVAGAVILYEALRQRSW